MPQVLITRIVDGVERVVSRRQLATIPPAGEEIFIDGVLHIVTAAHPGPNLEGEIIVERKV